MYCTLSSEPSHGEASTNGGPQQPPGPIKRRSDVLICLLGSALRHGAGDLLPGVAAHGKRAGSASALPPAA